MFAKSFLITDALYKIQSLFERGFLTEREAALLQKKIFRKTRTSHRKLQRILWWKYLLDTAQIGRTQFDDLKKKLLSSR